MTSTTKGFANVLKSFWKMPRFYLALLALFLPGLVLWQMPEWRYPFKLTTEQVPADNGGFILYHDFDNDGFSEQIKKGYDYAAKMHYLTVNKHRDRTIQQINFVDSLLAKWIFYGDYNQDGFEELIVFTQHKDSLFLSVVDVRPDKRLLDRHFLFKARQLSRTGLWDVNRIKASLVKSESGVPENILFFVQTEKAIYPRSVYVFNITQQKIIHQFDTESSLFDMLVYDLTGDRKEEVIVWGGSPDIVDTPLTPYDDDRCWLFVLNQQLELMFEPLEINGFPAGLDCRPVSHNYQPMLAVGFTNNGPKNIPSEIFYLNATGKKISGKIFRGRLDPKLFVNKNDQTIYTGINKPLRVLYRLSPDLQIINKHILKSKSMQLLFFQDVNNDGKSELFVLTDQFLQVFDEQLTQIARFPVSNLSYEFPFSFQMNGGDKPQDIAIHAINSQYIFTLQPNPIYSLLFLVYLATAGGLVFLFSGLEASIRSTLLYRQFFLQHIKSEADGVLIIDQKGRVCWSNGRLPGMPDVSQPGRKKQAVEQVLNRYPQIVNFIREAMKKDSKVQEKTYTVTRNGHADQLIIEVIPINFPGKLIPFYQVKFTPKSAGMTAERLKDWSKTSQKIAHDIKSPLSGLALNLKTLQRRVEKLSKGQKDEMSDDIEMMQVELAKIRNLTRKFMQFVDLEKPHFQAVAFEVILKNILKRFAPFSSDGLAVETNIEPDLPLLWADSYLIETVVAILVENAIDALEGKGVIEISASMAQYLDSVQLKVVEIEVADTGAGIDETLKEKIFDLHYSTKLHGSGIGLANAKKIVESHGGQIEVYSRKGFATVFRFSIPVFDENGL